jgi:putative ABC transport system ATP-binding protein
LDEPLVELTSVSRRFRPDVHALDSVSVRISLGEFVAIKGSSGSGKSTLLNVLGLLDRPTTGVYAFSGRDTSSLSDRERAKMRRDSLAFVFQAFHLISHLTVWENVALGLRYSELPAAAKTARIQEMVQSVGLNHRAQSFPFSLSGGEQQRVAIARALVRSPNLLLCDEPTGNLDSANTRSLLELLAAVPGPERALIVVTHESEVAETARRTLTMKDGRIIKDLQDES